jgi:serine phosphatase RsbU (regulator of sigma subunit)
MLGCAPGTAPPEATVRLNRGDVLVLYTDGVTEARGADGWLGDDGLARALREAGASAAAVATHVEHVAVAFQDDRPRDDIAVLAIRAR